MSSATHPRAAEVFKAALGTEGAARIALLDSQCAGDFVLRQEVESLLAADECAEAFLATPPMAVHALAAADADALVGQPVGSYRIVRRIASGGMGTVYEATDERLGRTVALKVVRGGPAFESALRRFEHEAKLLARLRHPAIAQIYDVGSHPMPGGSVPFFAMEYVPNVRTILDHARERALTIRQRLEIFAQVCDAVQYGHQRGVIHRDLKPSNILVSDEDGTEALRHEGTKGEKADVTSLRASVPSSLRACPKIIDFGVGRLVDSDQALTSVHTAYGQIVGTLQYMSPEQCGADPQDMDSRSDIYSLGMVLFELLTGRPPTR